MTATRPPIHLTPATTDAELARDWFFRFEGAGLTELSRRASACLIGRTKGSW